jgi:5-oxopent-3-ene-1,2,5-tricarboxylate decarboxylase / 2-hydroxyhepta-2,4-diene-1,7-dioate isomerase
MTTVQEYRSLDDIQVKEPIHWDIPISRPSKILCLGRNYKKHAQELGNDVPTEPIFFAKMPSAMIPHQGQIVLPRQVGQVDHEIELAIVIGKQGKNIPEAQAFDYVAGYTVVNDVTARAMQKMDIDNKLPWLRSKSFDTFCPIGPYVVPKSVVPRPQNLNLTLTVNGKIKQQSNTSFMIFKIPAIVSYLSRFMTLTPCDIIATGTPEGISELRPGDNVIAEIEQIGRLNNVVA